MGIIDRLFGPPGKDRFARLMIDRLRQAGETRSLTYDRDEFRLLGEGSQSFVVNLCNVYSEYCAARGPQRKAVLQNFLRSFFMGQEDLPDHFDGVRHDLFPSLRGRSYFELLELQQRAEDGQAIETPHERINDHLAAALVYDLPSAMRFITQGDLDEWGVSFYEAMEAAKENLARQEVAFVQLKNGLRVSHCNDGYAATRMLLAGMYGQLEIAGDALAAIPNRDTLLVAGTQAGDDALGMLAALAEQGLNESRPITGRIFRFSDGEWTPWLPDRSHPHFQAFKVLELRSEMMDYGEQKAALEKLHEQRHDAVRVANINAAKTNDGGAFSYCAWAAGAAALLPKVDKLAFICGEDQPPLVVDWAPAAEIVGDLMIPQQICPERYRVEAFPDAEQLAALAKLDAAGRP